MSPELDIYITCLLARLGDLPVTEGRKMIRAWVMDDVKETAFAGYNRARHTHSDGGSRHRTLASSSPTKIPV